jgi:hypothetical protein
MDTPAPIEERILMAGEQITLEIPLNVSAAGIYEVAVVLRNTSGITARGQRTFLMEDPFAGSAGAELALEVTSLGEAGDRWHFQARVANTGLQAVEAVSLHIAESGEGRVQLPEVQTGGSCRPSSDATRCRLSSPLGGGSEAIVDFFVGGPSGYLPALDVMVIAAGDEFFLDDNVWSSNSNLPKSDLSISSQRLRSRPLESIEALFRLEVMNEGQQPVAARVEGLLERTTLAIGHGDWVVVAEGGECVMPAQYCALGECGEALSTRQHYSCVFDAPLMPAESRDITISLRAADVGQSIRNMAAVVSGGSEVSSGDNLAAMEVRIGEEPPVPSPSDPQPDDQCYGSALLIAFGCVPGSD